MKKDPTTKILWAVYIGLLLVLLPHTAWLFSQFEPTEATLILGLFNWNMGDLAAWTGAFAFEAAIAVLTHKLAKHFEAQPKRLPAALVIPSPQWPPLAVIVSLINWRLSAWPKFSYRYLNVYSLGLLIAVGVSGLANLAHSVQFGRTLAIFAQWGIPAQVYQLAFGGILPVVSYLFARVLSNVVESEDAPNPELEELRAKFAEFRKTEKEAEQHLRSLIAEWQTKANDAEQRAMAAEQTARDAETRFAAAGDLFARLFAEEKRQRILAARQTWPELPVAAIAIIASASPSYVSEVINEGK